MRRRRRRRRGGGGGGREEEGAHKTSTLPFAALQRHLEKT